MPAPTKYFDIGKGAYFGGKNHAGMIPQLINNIPVHKRKWSVCVGRCAVMQWIKPALENIGTDIDYKVIKGWEKVKKKGDYHLEIRRDNIFEFLEHPFFMDEENFAFGDFPYPLTTRKNQKLRYAHEWTDMEHNFVLDAVKKWKCMVMICSYENPLYNDRLSDWRTHEYTGFTRKGKSEEIIYMNYEKPKYLHDTRFFGKDKFERELRRKRRDNWLKNMMNLEGYEKQQYFERWFETLEKEDALWIKTQLEKLLKE